MNDIWVRFPRIRSRPGCGDPYGTILLSLYHLRLMSVLDQFLSGITQSLRVRNGSRIAELIYLDVESLPPDRQQPYGQLNQQLKSQFPASQDGRLLERCRIAVPQDEFSSFATSFSESIARYFRYLRGVDTADNLSKALEIRQLTRQGSFRLKYPSN